MLGGLISNALGEGAGNGLITSALCMPIKKFDTTKLIIYFDLYEVLKADLSGFYNTVTPLSKVNVKFAVLDLSRNVVYISPYNTFTNGTAIELPNGKYTIKLLFSAYGFVGGEEQTVTVSGETVYTVKLYKRHFKAMTVTGGNYDAYNGTMVSYYGTNGATGQADEVIAISQINVYELKWDKWERVLNYSCVPARGYTLNTLSEYYYLNGQIRGIRNYQTQYFNGIVTSESGFSPPGGWYPGSYSVTFTGWEDGEAVFTTVRESGSTSTSKLSSSDMGLDNLGYIYNAAMLYHDGKVYSGEDSIDDDFYSKYKGKSLLKYQQETTDNMYVLKDPRNTNSSAIFDFVKIYLPTVNYFNKELLKEREAAEQNEDCFWGDFDTVKINEDGVVQSYNSKMIYNGLEVTKINSAKNFLWYSDDYNSKEEFLW